MTQPYEAEPDLDVIEKLTGPAIIEFGTNWCGYCRSAQPIIDSGLKDHAQIRHIKVEDGQGRPLGRAFGVKLWPTLVFLRDGKEVARSVRPREADAIREAAAAISE